MGWLDPTPPCLIAGNWLVADLLDTPYTAGRMEPICRFHAPVYPVRVMLRNPLEYAAEGASEPDAMLRSKAEKCTPVSRLGHET
jgi:hypothetical protein